MERIQNHEMAYRNTNTAARLARWREVLAQHPATYQRYGKLPPTWFRAINPPTVGYCDYSYFRGKRLNYGDGVGSGRQPDRPFRFCGYADSIIRLRHTGWYCDDSGDNLMRGTVFQLPARDGKEQYLAGVECGESSRKGFDVGGGWIDIDGRCIHDSKEDAARTADSLAENAANAEREYQEEENWRMQEEEKKEAHAERNEKRERLTDALREINDLLTDSGFQIELEEGVEDDPTDPDTLHIVNDKGERLEDCNPTLDAQSVLAKDYLRHLEETPKGKEG